MFSSGSTFLNKETHNIRSHLWVIISDPQQDPENVLIVNLTSVKAERDVDTACIVRPGEHSFVVIESYILYSGARITSTKKIQWAIQERLFRSYPPVCPELLQRIRRGLMVSIHSKTKYKELLRSQGLV